VSPVGCAEPKKLTALGVGHGASADSGFARSSNRRSGIRNIADAITEPLNFDGQRDFNARHA
jgi:hypothetical protein